MPEPFIVEIRDADDNLLVEMIERNYGVARNDAIQVEITRRLIVALNNSAKKAALASWTLIGLTAALVLLTLVLIFRA